jgi:hypothetical protein
LLGHPCRRRQRQRLCRVTHVVDDNDNGLPRVTHVVDDNDNGLPRVTHVVDDNDNGFAVSPTSSSSTTTSDVTAPAWPGSPGFGLALGGLGLGKS